MGSARQAKIERDEGIHRAFKGATRKDASWPERARWFLINYAANNDKFLAEDVTLAALESGYEPPTTDKAWGAIFRWASQSPHFIAKLGYGQSRRRHLSPAIKWKSLIYKGAK